MWVVILCAVAADNDFAAMAIITWSIADNNQPATSIVILSTRSPVSIPGLVLGGAAVTNPALLSFALMELTISGGMRHTGKVSKKLLPHTTHIALQSMPVQVQFNPDTFNRVVDYPYFSIGICYSNNIFVFCCCLYSFGKLFPYRESRPLMTNTHVHISKWIVINWWFRNSHEMKRLVFVV